MFFPRYETAPISPSVILATQSGAHHQAHQGSKLVPERLGDTEIILLGAAQHCQDMDHAEPRLENGTEPVYDTVRR
jgi:hypothetical protein